MIIFDFCGLFYFILNGHCMQSCCRMTKQISRGFRACFGGQKNIKSVMGNLHGNPANFQHNEGSWETWLRTAVARVLVIGWANKLAEVLEHLLGVKKYKKSFRKLGREGLQRQSQKTDSIKIGASRPHRYRSDAPPAETLLFLGLARVIL